MLKDEGWMHGERRRTDSHQPKTKNRLSMGEPSALLVLLRL